jgi:predicted nucleic acid-binding protein
VTRAEQAVYVDTSALAKWYVREPRSDDFEAWIQAVPTPTISSLTLVEMRCLFARRRRTGSLDEQSESRMYALFLQDIDRRYLNVEPLDDADIRSAVHLMSRVGAHPLRTLDAIHLSICTSREIGQLATADALLADAAGELGIEVVRFD